jgi:hypothetical protein
MTALALILFCLNPVELDVRDRCDVVEVNGFYDGEGNLVFEQAIWYRWDRNRERFDVMAWRLVKNGQPMPEFDWTSGKWVCRWNDGETPRVVSADGYRRTWLQYDPELADREYWPKEKRSELTAARPR